VSTTPDPIPPTGCPGEKPSVVRPFAVIVTTDFCASAMTAVRSMVWTVVALVVRAELGSVGVEGKVLVREADFFVAVLRFRPHATIDEHPGANDTLVVCLEGEGFTSVGDATARLRESERVFWPAKVPHRRRAARLSRDERGGLQCKLLPIPQFDDPSIRFQPQALHVRFQCGNHRPSALRPD
jgi:quercetin dioxygenase-like cupin family protein